MTTDFMPAIRAESAKAVSAANALNSTLSAIVQNPGDVTVDTGSPAFADLQEDRAETTLYTQLAQTINRLETAVESLNQRVNALSTG